MKDPTEPCRFSNRPATLIFPAKHSSKESANLKKKLGTEEREKAGQCEKTPVIKPFRKHSGILAMTWAAPFCPS